MSDIFKNTIPSDATDIEVFAIKPDDNGKLFAYIGYKIPAGFYFISVPFTEPAKEISDEEYYKNVFYQKQVMNPYSSWEYAYTAYEKGFMDFAKWHREQLKKKV